MQRVVAQLRADAGAAPRPENRTGLPDKLKAGAEPGPVVQTKLTIGAPTDKYEREADREAAQVVQRLHAPASQSIQPHVAPEAEQLQMKPLLQLKGSEGSLAAPPTVENSIHQLRGHGQPLAPPIRQPLEQAFGADFSGVRVHTDAQSDHLNRSIQAKAFTTGQDMFFRQGTYQPGSRGGQALLAHELTHVVQQDSERTKTNQHQTVQRLYDIGTFQNKTSAIGSRNYSRITSIDTALILYNNTTYDNVKKLTRLQALEALCRPFLAGRILRRKSGVEQLLAQIKIELPVVTALNDAITEVNKVSKVEKLRRVRDLWIENKGNWMSLPDNTGNAKNAEAALVTLWSGIETDMKATPTAYDGVTTNDYQKLIRLAGDPKLPQVTRDILNGIIATVAPLITNQQLTLKLAATSVAKKIGVGQYEVRGAANQIAGSPAALASLGHELTHVLVNQTFNNNFMMSIDPTDEGHIQEEGVYRTGLCNALKAAKNSLTPHLKDTQMSEVNHKLNYMAEQSAFSRYVNDSIANPNITGVPVVRSQQILRYMVNSNSNVGNNMIEYDAVLTQLLVLMHQWDIPMNNEFYTELLRVAQDAHDYRQAVSGGDPQGGRNRP